MRRTWKSSLGLILVFIATIVSFGWTQYRGDREATTAAITADDVYRHVKYLASDELRGRFTGSPEARKAADYIAAEFRRYGLKPVGEDGSYFQHFPFVAGVTLGTDNRFEAKVGGKATRYTVGEDFAPMTFSTEEPVEGEVVFAGYGISAKDLNYDDYAGVDVNGRTVLALRFSPDGDNPHSQFSRYADFRSKALMARQKGAKAIAFIADTDDFKDNSISRLKYDYSFSDSGIAAIAISRKAANDLLATADKTLDQLERKPEDRGLKIEDRKSGNEQVVAPLDPPSSILHPPSSGPLPGVTISLKVSLVKDTKQAANVVGFLEGRDPTLKNELVVIGAHFDHLGLGGDNSLAPKKVGEIHNGADDNASGTAGVLELAQAFAANRAELKRGLLFMAFSGEEEGLLGSNYYTKNPLLPLDRTVAMINMDMIGRMRDNKLMVQGLGTSPQWKPLVERLNQEAKFEIKPGEDGTGPSDHSSFYLKNLPVLFFFTGVHEDYHKPSDDVDKINTTDEARVVQFVYNIAKEITALPARPTFTKTAGTQRETRGFRVSLGTIPDYAEQVEGLKLSGVREGSPAEKAGLKAGDVIVRLGKIEVKNIYDYTFALGELKGGEEVEVEVLRDGRRVTVKVVPEKR
jgi:hypothetical protein